MNESKVFCADEFNDDPYIKNIDFKERDSEDFEFRYQEFMPYELLEYDVAKRIGGIADIPRIGFFTETFRYPSLVQKSLGETWMSVTPNEIYTMKKPIGNAKGKVLTLGCGMGYFAYMAALKSEVESVTIVEKNRQVIDLFESYILPQFENRDKITIIKSDAIEYIRNLEDGRYNYCFADIWLGNSDIQPYFAVKELGRKFRQTKFEYWIEDSFALYLSKYIWIEILRSFSKAARFEEPVIPSDLYTGIEKRITEYVHNLLKKAEITRPEDIDYYTNPKNIINLINKA